MSINAIGMTPIKKEQFCEILERTRRFSKMVGEVDKVALIDFADGHNHPFYYIESVARVLGELVGDHHGICEWWVFKYDENNGVSTKADTLYLRSEERETEVGYTFEDAGDVWDFIQRVIPLYTDEEIREGIER
jgi:hypothetical protein